VLAHARGRLTRRGTLWTEPQTDAGSASQLTLSWLAIVRWHLAVGAVLLVAWGADAPRLGAWALVALLGASNAALSALLRRRPALARPAHVLLVLALDAGLLAALLRQVGPAASPLYLLYLVHLGVAALALPPAWVAGLVAGATGASALLFLVPPVAGGEAGGGDAFVRLGLRGVWGAFVLTATLVAYFVSRLAGKLRAREEGLKTAQAREARTHTLAALSQLAAGAAHELNTPLGTIAVASRELERALAAAPAGEGAREDARLIRAEVERCRGILQRMSAAAGELLGESPRRVLASEVLAALPRHAPAGARGRLRVHVVQDGPLTCHVEALVQSLVNLVHNALEASAESGAPVEVAAEVGPTGARFTVEDAGGGMPPEVLARVGEPFLTTKPVGSGMGLGLFLVSTFTERAGGRLAFAPRPGGGTRVTLTLPAPPGGVP
jgi:two-component system sensor histidine kinase RegB